ncbi:MAG: nucleotidyltransferase domain-containing protein [Bacillota bacterium]|nr:nucleotidyltransferase domain-containing protein [Bacillota bacterium]
MSKKVGAGVSLEFHAMREHLMCLEKRDKQEHYQQALQKASEIAVMLQEKYDVKQVYLYGSLAWGGFDRHSDIDLFLVGFKGNYWQTFIDAEAIAKPIEVSLACEEDCVESLKEKVVTKGVLL